MNIRIKSVTTTTFAVVLLVLGLISAAIAEEVWIDVRSAEEYAADHLDGAKNIPHTEIAKEIDKLDLAKDAEIKLYCRSGVRAGMAKKSLEDLGYTKVENVGGLEQAKKLAAQ